MSLRMQGQNCLKTVEKNQKNIKKLESIVFNITKDNETDYKNLIYEIIGEKLNGKTCNEIVDSLNSQKYLWNNDVFL